MRLLNSCPHRGNIVCREHAGSAAQNFVCFYHAWNFDLDGSLVGVPDEQSYTPAFDRGAMGLRPVPRFENYKGMLFVSFDAGGGRSDQLSRQRPRISRLHARFRRRRCRDRPRRAGLQHEGQLEAADREQHRRLPRDGDAPSLFRAVPDRYRRRHQRLGRPAPAVGHRAGAGRRPQRDREPAAPDADHDAAPRTNSTGSARGWSRNSAPSGPTASPTSTATCSSSRT